jgi:hypothetical protein
MRAPAARLAAALLVGVVGLSACGSDDGSTTAQDTTPPAESGSTDDASEDPGSSLPECSDVWVAGVRLPTGYKGCAEDGEPVKSDRIRCSFGLMIITYDDRFYAVPGDRINESESLENDRDFARTVSSCQA